MKHALYALALLRKFYGFHLLVFIYVLVICPQLYLHIDFVSRLLFFTGRLLYAKTEFASSIIIGYLLNITFIFYLVVSWSILPLPQVRKAVPIQENTTLFIANTEDNFDRHNSVSRKLSCDVSLHTLKQDQGSRAHCCVAELNMCVALVCRDCHRIRYSHFVLQRYNYDRFWNYIGLNVVYIDTVGDKNFNAVIRRH